MVDGLLALQQRMTKPAIINEREEGSSSSSSSSTKRPLPTPPEAFVKVNKQSGNAGKETTTSSGSESEEVVSLDGSMADLAGFSSTISA